MFYIAGAALVGARTIGQYKLWLLDFTNIQSVQRWHAGEAIPEAECIDVSFAYTFEHVGPAGEIHTIDDTAYRLYEKNLRKRVPADLWMTAQLPLSVPVSATLWNQIPEDRRPLPPPPYRAQAYRLQVIARRVAGAVRYFAGFHVRVVAVDGQGAATVKFYEWTGREYGIYNVELGGPDVLAAGDHTTVQHEGDEGALFIAFDRLPAMPNLEAPKVPYGGSRPKDLENDLEAQGVRSSATTLRARPIVIAAGDDDAWLAGVRSQLVDEALALNEKAVMSAMDALLTRYPQTNEIQLVSHSNDDNLLVFDRWTLTEVAFSSMSPELKAKLRGKTLRLAGCNTAVGQRAEATLRALSARLGVTALGTRGMISLADFGPDGLLPERASVLRHEWTHFADGMLTHRMRQLGAPVEEAAADERGAALEELDAASMRAVQRVLSVVASASLPSFRVPGLLRKPTARVKLKTSDGKPAGCIDQLFLGELIRITRGDQEWVFAVQSPDVRKRLQPLFT